MQAPRPNRSRVVSRPASGLGFSVAALVVALGLVAATVWTMWQVKAAMQANAYQAMWADALLVAVVAVALGLLWPAVLSIRESLKIQQADLPSARVHATHSRTWGWVTLGYGVSLVVFLLLVLFVVANDVAVGRTFFLLPLIRDSFPLVAIAFVTNIFIAIIAQVLVLVLGLAVAIAKLLPGKPAGPVRFLATLYTDIFRSLPSIITIYLIGFGLPATGIPLIKNIPDIQLSLFGQPYTLQSNVWFAILAITLTYAAYVAEVYRAGIESIHPSQWSAARSLGLSYGQTLRHVVIPQAIRRIIPPLLNDFIGLQKDTSLVSAIGTVEAFNQARIIASNDFNLSAVSTVALFFILLTIPQTRLVDRMLAHK
jgi:polar amino acid transport system permease protein